MNTNKNLTIEETFNLAIKNHQENKIDIAQELYNQVLKVDPNHLSAINNLGVLFKKLNQIQKAKSCYEKVIQIDPKYTDDFFIDKTFSKKISLSHSSIQDKKPILTAGETIYL